MWLKLLKAIFVVLCYIPLLSFANNYPVRTTQISAHLQGLCEITPCITDIFDRENIHTLLIQHPEARELFNFLQQSEYEILVGSAVTNSSQQAELHLEFATSWRGVIIDEFHISAMYSAQHAHGVSEKLLAAWVDHLEHAQIFDAKTIYDAVSASDYNNQLTLPNTVGEFVIHKRVLYRDPMHGSITRYIHPQYIDAVLDVSVYPVSPFMHADDLSDAELLNAELDAEKIQFQALIERSDVLGFQISDIESVDLSYADRTMTGYKLSVSLNTKLENAFSTQYVFKQGDKFVKLTGNFPDNVMQGLVASSIPHIRVPAESEFMRAMRAN